MSATLHCGITEEAFFVMPGAKKPYHIPVKKVTPQRIIRAYTAQHPDQIPKVVVYTKALNFDGSKLEDGGKLSSSSEESDEN